MLHKVAWADTWFTTQGSAHTTMRSTLSTLSDMVFFDINQRQLDPGRFSVGLWIQNHWRTKLYVYFGVNRLYFRAMVKKHWKMEITPLLTPLPLIDPLHFVFNLDLYLLFQILPWTGQIMLCGGLKRIFGWTKPDGPLISTISQPMLSSISHQCTKPYGYNCQIYDSSIVKLISGM